MELSREKIVALTVAAAVFLLLGVTFIFFAPRWSKLEQAKKEYQALQNQLSQSKAEIAELKKNPPQKMTVPEPVLPEPKQLSLSGILWDQSCPHAIVNNVVVSVGEEVNGFKVLEITPAKVVLDDGSGSRELLME